VSAIERIIFEFIHSLLRDYDMASFKGSFNHPVQLGQDFPGLALDSNVKPDAGALDFVVNKGRHSLCHGRKLVCRVYLQAGADYKDKVRLFYIPQCPVPGILRQRLAKQHNPRPKPSAAAAAVRPVNKILDCTRPAAAAAPYAFKRTVQFVHPAASGGFMKTVYVLRRYAVD
jgi:hypothetical protein